MESKTTEFSFVLRNFIAVSSCSNDQVTYEANKELRTMQTRQVQLTTPTFDILNI